MPFLALSWAELLSSISLIAVVGPFGEPVAAQALFALHFFVLHFPPSHVSPLFWCEAQWTVVLLGFPPSGVTLAP